MIPHRQVFVGPFGSCFATAVACALDLELAEVPNFVAFGKGRWFDAFGLWAKARGVHVRRIDPPTPVPRRRLVIASGMGPRGFRHAVLMRDGRLVHDPYPGDKGLVGKPDGYWILSRCRSRGRCRKGCDAPIRGNT